MKARKKGASRILVLAAISFTMIMLSYSSLATSYQKAVDGDKISIITSLGDPVLDITLLENTDQCLSRCHATLLIQPYQDLALPGQPTQSESLEFLTQQDHKGLSSSSFEILAEEQYNSTVPAYETVDTTCSDNRSAPYNCRETRRSGETTETRTMQKWEPFPFWGETLKAGNNYTIRITGKKIPTLGPNNVDWLLTLRGLPLTEWAWWNSSWTYRRQVTITNNHQAEALAEGYSINLTFNHSILVQEGKSLPSGIDVRIVFNSLTELEWQNTTEFNRSDSTIWFPLNESIQPGSSSQSYHIYYGNPQASKPEADASSVFLLYDNFDDENCDGWTVFTSTWSCSGQYLRSTHGGSPDPWIYRSLSHTLGPVSVSYQATSGSAGWPNRVYLINKVSAPFWTGMFGYLQRAETQWRLSKTIQGILSDVISSPSGITAGWHNASFTRNSTGFWNMSINNINQGGAADTSYSDASFVLIGLPIPSKDAGVDNLIIRLYLHPEPTATLEPEDAGNGTLQITDLTLLQVIKNVDLVKGKRTLARTTLDFNEGTDNITRQATAKAYLGGQFQAEGTLTLQGGLNNLDVFFTPNPAMAANNQSFNLTVEVSSTVLGFSTTNISKQVNIVRTRELNVTFVPIDGVTGFHQKVSNDVGFIQQVYPIADGNINLKNASNMNSPFTNPFFIPPDPFSKLAATFLQVYAASVINGEFPERAVGIVPENWFEDNIGLQIDGMSLLVFFPAVLVENSFIATKSTSAHELGHTYFLCDEYNKTEWSWQDPLLKIIGDGCGNGDANNDSILDQICEDNDGCPTLSLKPLTNQPDNFQLRNFMGDNGFQSERWVSNDSYNTLLSHFSHFSPQNASKRIVVTGFYNKTSQTANFSNFYQLGSGLVINQSEFTQGSFSLEVMENSTLSYNISFDLGFRATFSNGNSTEINYTPFIFVIPFNENITQFVFKENITTKDIVNVSANKPNITLLSPNGGEHFSNQEINISWNASDADGDNLSYAVLFSPDNGTTFTTLAIDLNQISLIINSSILPDTKNAIIRVLATDSVNTGNDTSNSVFEIDNDLNVTVFKAVYTNQTQRTFEIKLNNTINLNITNISWSLNTGENIKSSQFTFNLKPSEQIFLYLYHNYSLPGNYTVIFTAQTIDLSETESINITI